MGALLVCFAPVAFGQSTQISGLVLDPQGHVVPNASVVLTQAETNVDRNEHTNQEGLYSFASLNLGLYRLTVTAAGFTKVVSDEFPIETGQKAALDFTLQLGPEQQTITVTGDSTVVQTQSAALSTVVSQQLAANLPLNGRSFDALYLLAPGVQAYTTNLGGGTYSVNGQRPESNQYYVDGVSANFGAYPTATLALTGSGGLPAQSSTHGTNSLLSVEALQEFRIQTSSYSPEYGRTPGGQVEITSHSGTNRFHGSLYDYFRNDKLDANNWFNNGLRINRPPERQNDFGGVFGGPITRSRTFFFFSYEGLRLLQPTTVLTTEPTVATRSSAPANVQPILSLFPLPNGPDVVQNGVPTGLGQFGKAYSGHYNVDTYSIRIDHHWSDSLILFGRYDRAPSSSSSLANAQSSSTIRVPVDTVTGGVTWIVTPRMSNEFRANWSRTSVSTLGQPFTLGIQNFPTFETLFPGRTPDNANFGVNLAFIPSGSSGWGVGANNTQRQINITDNVAWTIGTHQIKLGVDYRRLNPTRAFTQNSLSYTFNTLASLLAGTATSATVSTYAVNSFVAPVFSAYAADTWRTTKRVVLTYGLRWDVAPAPSFTQGPGLLAVTQISNPAVTAIAPAGTPLYGTVYTNLAPRLGIAYSLFERTSWNTILHGGWGIFYDVQNPLVGYTLGAPPGSASTLYTNPTYPLTPTQLTPPVIALTPPFLNSTAFDPKTKTARTYQWNVTLEQQIARSSTLSAGYVGALGRDLYRQIDLANINPSFTGLTNFAGNYGASNYNALQVQLRSRIQSSVTMTASYAWSHSIDNGSAYPYGGISGYGVPTIGYNPDSDRASSDFDTRHTFTFGAHYEIGRHGVNGWSRQILSGWSLDPVFRAQSGRPVNPYINAFVQGLQVFARPDLVPGVPLYISNPTLPGGRQINPAAVSNFITSSTTIATVRQGTLPRNFFEGFPQYQLDLGMARRFAIRERIALTCRAELFNATNHANFDLPNPSVTATTFGQATATANNAFGFTSQIPIFLQGGPRSAQLSLKLSF
ncbi:MAG: TonB-dependent receptor [Acidobacteriia bacterium]|nr:TonB-dependent receptor [Terriglobia bacterium]